ncbi:MAG: hypothetical protein JXQ96_00190 [Cyclobacteriaceae bacterium]
MKFFIIIKEDSERVPKKNFQMLGEFPLWQHLVRELEGYEVYIDTDSRTVLSECKNLGWVTAYPRKQQFIDYENSNASNLSPAIKMIDNFLDKYVVDDEEIIVTTHVTSPFLKIETILDAVEILNTNSDYDSVHSITRHQEFSWLGDKMIPINFNPDVIQKTQDLPCITMSNGAFFIFRKKTFKKYGNRIGESPFYYELSPPEDIEIDYKNDLILAELVNKGLCK